MITDYDSLDSVAMADLVRRNELTPDELLDEATRRTEERDGALNAVTTRFYEHAKGRIAAGLPDGPLKGVPFLLKDLGVYYAGFPTTGGSRLFADFTSPVDSTLADRYVAAGLVIFGKTSLSEFGLSATSESVLLGVCRNPWNLEYTTGGSSGGAVAAVAGGILPSAHAADGGGSIRIPAAHCGLFGLKPTRGRIPLGPHIAESWAGMTAHHVVTRSVRDSAVLLDISQGEAPGDPYCAPPAAASYLDLVAQEPGRLKVAVSLQSFEGVALDPQVRDAIEETARLCESLGHDVEWIDLDTVITPEEYLDHRANIIHASMFTSLSRRNQALGREFTHRGPGADHLPLRRRRPPCERASLSDGHPDPAAHEPGPRRTVRALGRHARPGHRAPAAQARRGGHAEHRTRALQADGAPALRLHLGVERHRPPGHVGAVAYVQGRPAHRRPVRRPLRRRGHAVQAGRATGARGAVVREDAEGRLRRAFHGHAVPDALSHAVTPGARSRLRGLHDGSHAPL